MEELRGTVVFEPAFSDPDALRGLGDFDFVWLIWGFSANDEAEQHLTVRPPRLGGNRRMGVFASRSPFRPNGLGLSCVRIESIEQGKIHVRGADLMDGTPIYDVKPYVPYADAHPDARGGFTDATGWRELEVVFPEKLLKSFSAEEQTALRRLLALDPRPHYHHDAERVYGFPFAGRDVRFRVDNGVLTVVDVIQKK